MITLSISNARNKLHKLAMACTKYDEVATITTKNGNVVLLSENEYKSLVESLYLAGIKGVYEDVEKATKTPAEEFLKDIL